jgi:hypothetical protein
MYPPPGAMMTAVPLLLAGQGRNSVMVGTPACSLPNVPLRIPIPQRERSDAQKIVRRWQIGACRLRVGRDGEDKQESNQSDSSQFHIHPFLYSFGA